MDKIIFTTQAELETIIDASVSKAFSQHSKKEESPQDILTINEAAQFLNLAKQTIYSFTSNRTIPFIKKGKKLYFEKSKLEKWLLAGRKL